MQINLYNEIKFVLKNVIFIQMHLIGRFSFKLHMHVR